MTHLVQRLSDGGRTVTVRRRTTFFIEPLPSLCAAPQFPQLIEFVESMEISKGADHV